ncbi:MAG: DUF58 domain-containing protein [Proteobacteria bacterium]|nr:DUF58 domain-containing protein [Pseudomonadota bacterium]
MPQSDRTATERQLRLQHEAERASGRLPPLQIAAERVAATVAQGVHGRRRVGQGETFWQFRRYQTGDAATSIDWRQSAKSRHYFVRENEWEAAQTAWLWRDTSPSMHYSSDRQLPTKAERADLLLLATASLLMRAGERFTLLGGGRRAGMGRRGYDQLAEMIARGAGSETGLPPFEPLPRYSQVILFGDFLAAPEEVHDRVSALASRGVSGLLVQVIDPAERGLPFRGRVRFEGFENEGNTLLGRVEATREEYRSRFERHCASLQELTRRAGWVYLRHETDHSPESALLTLYAALAPNTQRI